MNKQLQLDHFSLSPIFDGFGASGPLWTPSKQRQNMKTHQNTMKPIARLNAYVLPRSGTFRRRASTTCRWLENWGSSIMFSYQEKHSAASCSFLGFPQSQMRRCMVFWCVFIIFLLVPLPSIVFFCKTSRPSFSAFGGVYEPSISWRTPGSAICQGWAASWAWRFAEWKNMKNTLSVGFVELVQMGFLMVVEMFMADFMCFYGRFCLVLLCLTELILRWLCELGLLQCLGSQSQNKHKQPTSPPDLPPTTPFNKTNQPTDSPTGRGLLQGRGSVGHLGPSVDLHLTGLGRGSPAGCSRWLGLACWSGTKGPASWDVIKV